MENLTIKQQLLQLGMKETEIDTHESDLLVLQNDISTKWLESYEFENNVTTFVEWQTETIWYDIPFGNMPEHFAKTKGGK